MVNPILALARGLTIVAVVCLFLSTKNLIGSPSLNDSWSQSLDALKRDSPKEACALLKHWVSLKSQEGIQSAEPFFNLSLCSWQLKERSQAVVYALTSLNLRNSPLKRNSDIRLLQSFQKEIGIRDNLPSRNSFILKMISPTGFLIFLGFLGGWILIGTLTFRKNKTSIHPLSIIGISICGIGMIFFIFIHQLGGPIGVITADKEVPIFAFDKSGNPEELALLPSGTMIELGVNKNENKNEFVQVLQPMGGWIKKESIETVIP